MCVTIELGHLLRCDSRRSCRTEDDGGSLEDEDAATPARVAAPWFALELLAPGGCMLGGRDEEEPGAITVSTDGVVWLSLARGVRDSGLSGLLALALILVGIKVERRGRK